MSETCQTCQHWTRLGVWWGRCTNEKRTAIETEDPGAGPEMTRKTFTCDAWGADKREAEPLLKIS